MKNFLRKFLVRFVSIWGEKKPNRIKWKIDSERLSIVYVENIRKILHLYTYLYKGMVPS